MRVRANYRDRNCNPFVQTHRHFNNQFGYIDADIPDGTPEKEIIEMAKSSTPEGKVFVDIEVLDD